MATLLPGHRDPAYAGDRAEAAALWGVDALPEAPGASALELFERAREGRIKVLWIAATNPAQSMPDQARARRFGARGFRDRAGSLCRRRDAGPCRPVLPAATAGEIRHHDQFRSAASAACGPPSRRRATPCPTGGWRRRLRSGWRPASRRARPRCSAIAMKARCTPSTPDDGGPGSGLQRAGLPDAGARRSAAVAVSRGQGRARLYGDGRYPTPDGRARFHDLGYRPPVESVSAHYPLKLTTGGCATIGTRWRAPRSPAC